MASQRFDAWTRRRFGLATGGLLSALLNLDAAWDGAARKRKKRHKHKNKKRCGGSQKRCQGKCIPRAECCGDCPSGTYCCEGTCIRLERCCGSGPCDAGCPCRRTIGSGLQICVSNDLAECAQCESTDDCAPGERCVLESCGGGVTAICRQLCLV
jgi:hypothetical protein